MGSTSESNGGLAATRTPDLYRVKVAQINDVQHDPAKINDLGVFDPLHKCSGESFKASTAPDCSSPKLPSGPHRGRCLNDPAVPLRHLLFVRATTDRGRLRRALDAEIKIRMAGGGA